MFPFRSTCASTSRSTAFGVSWVSALSTLSNNSQNHKHHPLTLVTATLAPLFINWTTLSARPLCEATRRCSESVRTSAASSWLMKQRSRCCNSQTRSYREHRGQPMSQTFAFMLPKQLPPSSATRDRKPTRRNTWSVKP